MLNGLKRPRPMSHDADAESPSSKRSASQEVEESPARTPASGNMDSDELASESEKLDRMELVEPPPASAGAGASKRPPAREQHATIMPLMSLMLQPGTKVYIVKRAWYRSWQSAVSAEEDSKEEAPVTVDTLGPIDNVGLTDGSGRLAEPPQPDQNIIVATEEVYLHWLSWYGENEAGVRRNVISKAGDPSGFVEYFPITIHACLVIEDKPNEMEEHHRRGMFQLSETESVGNLRALLQQHLHCSSDNRIWRYTPEQKAAPPPLLSGQAAQELAPPHVTASSILRHPAAFEKLADLSDSLSLADAGLDGVDLFLAVEEQNEDESWLVSDAIPVQEPAPKPQFGNGYFSNKAGASPAAGSSMQVKYKSKDAAPVASSSQLRPTTRSQTQPKGNTPGLTGLSNLGNTCFMNSALQCLSNTPELRKYFESDAWQAELNEDNPLGMDGKVARAFAGVLQALWKGNASSFTPRDFKQTIGRFRPMFLGWSQQDSQELIAFLLDGLHEDLNRIIKKPYVEIPDWEGEPTPQRMYEHAAHMWELYRRRNDSVMVDLFFGQFRSTLTCLECGKVSYKFDEFSSVTLSLPKQPVNYSFKCIPLDPSKPRVEVKLELSPEATIRDAINKASALTGMTSKRVVPYEIHGGRIWKWVQDFEPVTSYRKEDVIIFYELEHEWRVTSRPVRDKRRLTLAERDAEAGIVLVPVSSVKASSKGTYGNRWEKLASPILLALKAEEVTSQDALYKAVVRQVARYSVRGASMFEVDDEEDPPSLGEGEWPKLPAADVPPTEDKAFFRMYVPKTPSRDKPGENEYRDGDLVPLFERVNKRADEKKPAKPIPGAFPTPPEDDDELPTIEAALSALHQPAADDVAASAQPAEQPTEAVAEIPEPVIATGDAVYLEWDPRAWKVFFEDGNSSLIESFKKVVDPAIEKNEHERKTRSLSLDSCLTDFCKPERLGEDNPWKCPVCDKLQENTSKQMDLWKVPDVLVIHLKRFSKGGGYSWQKTGDFVDFPLEDWDLTNWVEGRRVAEQLKQTPEGRTLLGPDFEDKPLIYDLFAVDNHYGGMGGGHYTAFAKNEITGNWYYFDDSHVTERQPDDVKTNAAYLLFYRRRSDKTLGSVKTSEVIADALQSRSVSSLGEEQQPQEESFVDPAAPAIGKMNFTGLPPTPPDEDLLQRQRSSRGFMGPMLPPPNPMDILPRVNSIPTINMSELDLPTGPSWDSTGWDSSLDLGRRGSDASDHAARGSEDEDVSTTLLPSAPESPSQHWEKIPIPSHPELYPGIVDLGERSSYLEAEGAHSNILSPGGEAQGELPSYGDAQIQADIPVDPTLMAAEDGYVHVRADSVE